MYKETIEILKELVGHEYQYFDTALKIYESPLMHSFDAWAACTNPDGNMLYIMDNNEEWHNLENDLKNDVIVATLYARVSAIKNRTLKQSRA